MKTVLVTGGAGFIACHFIKVLLKTKLYKVLNLDKLTYAGNYANVAEFDLNPDYAFIKGDICDSKLVSKLMPQVDYIFNFAAETHVDNSIMDPDVFVQTNIVGTHNLLNCARKASRLKLFCQVSTDEVTGSANGDVIFSETSPLNPSSPYSASKAAADMLALSYFKTYGVPVIITRSCNNFGPNQHIEKLIPKLITNVLQNKKMPIYGSGTHIRDWISVGGNCDALYYLMLCGMPGEIYNISLQCLKTNLEVVGEVLKIFGKDDHSSVIGYVPDRLGHDYSYRISNKKLRDMGWRYSENFTEKLVETIKWYETNKEWWV